MFIVGLTGGIATGKSTVAEMLKNKGAVVLDADAIAREVVEPGRPAWKDIVKWQGRKILNEDNSIDRVKLGRVVFTDEEARRRLNSIVHPRVDEELSERTRQIRSGSTSTVIVYDVPLLIEAGMHHKVDVVVLVCASRETQVKRMVQREGLQEEEVKQRIEAQMPLEQKIKYAHFVIKNDGELEQTRGQVDEFWRYLTNKMKKNSSNYSPG